MWSKSQDSSLMIMVEENGPQAWDKISSAIPGRTGKQCRERWFNQLNPLLKKTEWSHEEEWVLLILNQGSANTWAFFADILLGRSDNTIKNYWNTILVPRKTEM